MARNANPDGSRPLVLLATAEDCWELDEDAQPLLAALDRIDVRAEPAIWDDPEVPWETAAAVVVRSTWDYALRRSEFLTWAREVAAVVPLLNPPEVLRWNTDKRYLGELARTGLPVVPTTYIEPGSPAAADPADALDVSMAFSGQAVVKPSVSAGSRDTARFDRDHLGEALELVNRIVSEGRTAMLQPYLETVDHRGETGLVYFGGEFSHAFNKAALLTGVGEMDHGIFALETIAAATPTPDERELADLIVDATTERFAGAPTYARVDLLAGADTEPLLLELELTEPSWFLSTDPAAADRAAAVISAELA